MSGLSEEARTLVDRYVDDVATPQEITELNGLLASDDEVAGYFAEVAKLNSLLLEHAQERAATGEREGGETEVTCRNRTSRSSSRRSRSVSRRGRPVCERQRTASRRRPPAARDRSAVARRSDRRRRPMIGWLAAGGAVAVTAAAVAMVLIFFPPGETKAPPRCAWTARISKFRGKPRLYRNAAELELKAGVSLEPGDCVLTDKGSLFAFSYGDGTTVELNRGGQLSLGAERCSKELLLDSGDLYVVASCQPKSCPLTVNKGRYDQVTVVGTRFEVSRSDEATTLKVAEGAVLFGGGKALAVSERHSSRVSRVGVPSAPRPTEVAAIAPWRKNRTPWLEPREVKTGISMPARFLLQAGDPDGDHLSFSIVRPPAHGKISGTAPDLIYEPESGYTGTDRLEVKVSDGLAESEAVEIAISVSKPNRAPVAVMEAGPGRGKAPLTVNFYAQGSRDPDGGAVTCTWEFGDGSRGKGLTTKHVYLKPGRYTAKLIVRDENGATAEKEQEVIALAPDAVNAPVRLRWHFKLEGSRSYLSWTNNADNADGFYVESAVVVKGRKQMFERVATLGPGETLWRLQYRREYSGKWVFFRVRAFNKTRKRISEPSNSVKLGYGVGKGGGRDVNWPPPGLDQVK